MPIEDLLRGQQIVFTSTYLVGDIAEEIGVYASRNKTWSFFIMQFPKQKKALMTTTVGTPLGTYPISSLFTHDAPKNANGVLEPKYRWNLEDIKITALADKVGSAHNPS